MAEQSGYHKVPTPGGPAHGGTEYKDVPKYTGNVASGTYESTAEAEARGAGHGGWAGWAGGPLGRECPLRSRPKARLRVLVQMPLTPASRPGRLGAAGRPAPLPLLSTQSPQALRRAWRAATPPASAP